MILRMLQCQIRSGLTCRHAGAHDAYGSQSLMIGGQAAPGEKKAGDPRILQTARRDACGFGSIKEAEFRAACILTLFHRPPGKGDVISVADTCREFFTGECMITDIACGLADTGVRG